MAKDRALHLLPSLQTCAGLVLTLHNTVYEKVSFVERVVHEKTEYGGYQLNEDGIFIQADEHWMAAPDRFLSVSIAFLEVILKLGHTRDQPGEKQVYTRKPKNRSMYFVQEDHCTCNGK
ncbi:hypothetical protein QYE76_003092 [Lolium multiflorum]|uniref:Uncharacterized protein n=1 Tax=Lolium multiflorum TaxID=4521 RepID=A0AAD8RQ77_LOLMU|nr:hypothetical protein QYE76_003092 [Lolium multiflorum]